LITVRSRHSDSSWITGIFVTPITDFGQFISTVSGKDITCHPCFTSPEFGYYIQCAQETCGSATHARYLTNFTWQFSFTDGLSMRVCHAVVAFSM
jgi:hypothetical protein